MTQVHVHEWSAEESEEGRPPRHACVSCGETCPACNVCGGPTGNALLACQRCLDREDEVLAGIGDALDLYQPQPRSAISPVRYDRDRVHANSTGSGEGQAAEDSPDEVRAHLMEWVTAWSDLSRDPQQVGPIEYLRGHLLWAAHNEASGWPDFRREMRQLRHRARRLAGLLPQRQEGSCIYCGADVVRDWADERWQPRPDGLSDELRCVRCRTTWGGVGAWRFANLHTIRQLPDTNPEVLVTREQARSIWPEVPAATWRDWVRRDAARAERCLVWQERLAAGYIGPEPEPERMPVRSWDVRGLGLYRLADLTRHVEAWASDARVMRRAG